LFGQQFLFLFLKNTASLAKQTYFSKGTTMTGLSWSSWLLIITAVASVSIHGAVATVGFDTVTEQIHKSSNIFEQAFDVEEGEDYENEPTTGTVDTGISSCFKDSESLIGYEDIRMELSFINLYYLEHGTRNRACTVNADNDENGNSGLYSNCHVDFLEASANLNEVCAKHDGKYSETEHSIQCYNSQTNEQLYYQLDHFPGCFAVSCTKHDIDQFITKQVDYVRRALEDAGGGAGTSGEGSTKLSSSSTSSGMVCYADYDILRHPNALSTSTNTTSMANAATTDSSSSSSVTTFMMITTTFVMGFVLFYL
jgi:hypothetical protein